MDETNAADAMSRMTFPTIAEQMSPKWFGGGVQDHLAGVAKVYVDTGSIDFALDSYEPFINTQPIHEAGLPLLVRRLWTLGIKFIQNQQIT